MILEPCPACAPTDDELLSRPGENQGTPLVVCTLCKGTRLVEHAH